MSREYLTSSDNIIDSRDVIERIEELEGYRDDAQSHAEGLLEELKELQSREQSEELPETESWTLADSDRLVVLQIETEKTWSNDGKREFYANDDFDEDAEEELFQLLELQEQAEGCSDWNSDATLINDDYFDTYAEEVASDISDYDPNNVRWPYNCIDWGQAGSELQQDYTSVEFNGTTFWVR